MAWWLLLKLVPRQVWMLVALGAVLTALGVVDLVTPLVGALEAAWTDLLNWIEGLAWDNIVPW